MAPDVDTEIAIVDALAVARDALARGDAAAALAALRIVAAEDPSRLPTFAPGTPEATLVEAARFLPVTAPEIPVETVTFDPGGDHVTTMTPGVRAVLDGPVPEPVAIETRAQRRFTAAEERRHVSFLAGTALCAVAGGATYLLAVERSEDFFDSNTPGTDLDRLRGATNSLVGVSGVFAAGGLVLGATAVITW